MLFATSAAIFYTMEMNLNLQTKFSINIMGNVPNAVGNLLSYL